MLNNSYWKEYNDGARAILWSANGETLAHIQRKDTVWDCIIWPKLIAENFYWRGTDSIAEVEHQITLYIYNRCNKGAIQFRRIRDSLSSLLGLPDMAKKGGRKMNNVYVVTHIDKNDEPQIKVFDNPVDASAYSRYCYKKYGINNVWIDECEVYGSREQRSRQLNK